MPAYPGNDLARLIYENEQKHFFLNETVPAGTLSKGFQLRRERGNFYPWGFSIEVKFAADPGVFEVDIMGADTDQAGFYVPIAQLTAVSLTPNFAGRIELTQFWAKYIAVKVVTLTNAVAITAMGTR